MDIVVVASLTVGMILAIYAVFAVIVAVVVALMLISKGDGVFFSGFFGFALGLVWPVPVMAEIVGIIAKAIYRICEEKK